MTALPHPPPTDPSSPQTFTQCLAHFLTPQVCKQAQQAAPRRRAWRWQTQPLIHVLLVMTWCTGDSLPERFETARAFYVACHQRRRRPGKTFAGFEQALGTLPTRVLRATAAGLRRRLAQVLADRWECDGFVPLGCDGSRLACPRSEELEKRLVMFKKKKRRKKAKKAAQAADAPRPRKTPASYAERTPQVWVTAVLHLGLEVLWSWRLGTGTASEREHLRQLIGTVPAHTLLVADAGYVGYELLLALHQAGLSSGQTHYRLPELFVFTC